MEEPSTPPNPLARSKENINQNQHRGCGSIRIANAMADDNGGDYDEGLSPPSRSVFGIYRRKHTLRAIFRSSSLVLLVGGYALYNHFGEGSNGGMVPPSQHLKSDPIGAGTSNLRNSIDDNRHKNFINFSRSLVDGEVEGAQELVLDLAEEEPPPCPVLEVADPKWFAVLYALGTFYMFLALAIVCDEFFVPALEEMSSERYLNLSMDVAGATLMAAGGSAPELFTSLVGTFKQSDIGIGTIVGSAVFNVLFVIGMCSILSKEVLTLTWWPLFRDTSYYAVGLIVLSVLAGVVSKGIIYWWEALILLVMYFGYVLLMYYNRKLYTKLTGKELVLPGESDNDTLAEDEEQAVSTKPGDMGGNHTPLLSDDGLKSSSDHKSSALSQTAMPTNDNPCTTTDFRWPGTFRAGVLQLLLHPEAWEQKAGIGIVTKIEGDVDTTFKQVDINGDGSIDKEELRKLFAKLEHDISDEELSEAFSSLDLDSDGTISEDEFMNWYLKSEKHVLSKVKPIFDTFDADKSGAIDRYEVSELLKKLEPNVKESDVDDAINAMYKSGSTEEITFEEFANWYMNFIATSHQHSYGLQIEEESQGICAALTPPRGEGFLAWSKYLIVLPLVAALTFTIPDVRRQGWGNWCYASFFLSILWIALFSFAMVTWVEIVGNTIGIPSVIMGLTVLAAGTSVPDLFSSVIVARMGQGDMAVSSSIGSNIFDILVGLPLPWLVFLLWPSTPNVVLIQAQGIWQSIFILIGMLVAIIVIVHCQGWKMTKTLGGIMFLLYFAFLVQAFVTEYYRNPCFG
eukprot:CAMPEP_0196159006 /NCGR_PEP_ID=MMETSP0910-20130528/46103_1 /TAXON_ID=49265 /ORGANISM="Thalassiosira rotula, Strain GSO102" /LENGTH=794 /DNA_ID=CAMNT_0041423919 /DNA_START=913 /DNA_END=3297 /DNA_ORIENTATION=+